MTLPFSNIPKLSEVSNGGERSAPLAPIVVGADQAIDMKASVDSQRYAYFQQETSAA